MVIEFITTRELENKGRVRIVKLKEEGEALVDYICPKCGFTEKRKEVWTEPLVTGTGINKKFCIVCKKCGFEIKFKKLKREIKKK